jgi:hypothetical protein
VDELLRRLTAAGSSGGGAGDDGLSALEALLPP